MDGPLSVDWIGLYLEEDLGVPLPAGASAALSQDITSAPLFPPGHGGRARIVARERAFLAGMAGLREVFQRLGASASAMEDGQWVRAGTEAAVVTGPVRAILAGERTVLNLVSRMSGIATVTREAVDALAAVGGRARVAATRKTTPGFRHFEKEAVRLGGGETHRTGLFDEAMVKDNHREAFAALLAGGATAAHSRQGAPVAPVAPGPVAEAVRRIRAAHPGKVLCCEVESLADAHEAAGAGADWLLIDNQEPATGKAWAEALRAAFPDVRIEASGGIRPETVVEYAWADRISLGWLTQKAPAKDFSLEWMGNK